MIALGIFTVLLGVMLLTCESEPDPSSLKSWMIALSGCAAGVVGMCLIFG